MPHRFFRPALAAALALSVLAPAAWAAQPAQQGGAPHAPPAPQSAPAAFPPACVCAKEFHLPNEGKVFNCQCGTLQCVVLVASKAGIAQAPALSCVKP